MTKNFLIPSCIAAMVVAGGLAGVTAFQYTNGNEADRYYTAQTNALQSATKNTITLAMRAAQDASYIGELQAAVAQVESSLTALKNGNSGAGIAPLPASAAASLNGFGEAWLSILSGVTGIASSRDSNSGFVRLAEETRSQVKTLLEEANKAYQVVEPSTSVQPRVKAALQKAVDDLNQGSEMLVQGASVNSDALRMALAAANAYVTTLGSVGSAMPREKAVIDPPPPPPPPPQSVQRSAQRAAEAAVGSVDNGPNARAVWNERSGVETSLSTLAHAVSNLPNARFVTPMIMLGTLSLAILVVMGSVALILRQAKSRTRQAEFLGSSIQSSQKERSNEIAQLFEEMELVRNGDLTVEFTRGLSSTNEIATTLNKVFLQFRGLVKDVQQTIVSLSAASEETLTMARNVNRNRQEQDHAIQHIAKLVKELQLFIEQMDALTNQTKNTSQEVTDQIKAGSIAVEDVHEGIIKLSQSNMNIMHHNKAMTENIQSLERLVEVVRKVANQSANAAMNAFLAADAISDDDLSKRVRISATAMQALTTSADEASEQIATSLRGINDAAKDTQYVLDDSQKEIKELSNRSSNALSSLSTIREESTKLAQSIISVTEQTSQLQAQSDQVSHTMTSIHHYSSEHSAASEQTAAAISNLNSQAQQVGETLAHFKV